MAEPYIVGFGIACLDYIVVAPRIEHGERTHADSFWVEGGGLTGTSIVAAARLGARAKLLGRIGDDEVGEQIVEGLRAENVDTSDLIKTPGGESLVSVIVVDNKTAERTIYSRMDEDTECSTGLIALGALAGADALLLDPHWLEGALVVARRAKELGVPIVCDMDITPRNRDVLALCDYPVVPRSSALSLSPSGDPFEAIDRIRNFGPRAVVITCGPDGAYYADDEVKGHVEAFKVDAVDTTGAGDVFHGAFAVGLAQSWGLREIVTFASAVAAIKCTKVGGRAGIPTFDQTMEFLASRGARL